MSAISSYNDVSFAGIHLGILSENSFVIVANKDRSKRTVKLFFKHDESVTSYESFRTTNNFLKNEV